MSTTLSSACKLLNQNGIAYRSRTGLVADLANDLSRRGRMVERDQRLEFETQTSAP